MSYKRIKSSELVKGLHVLPDGQFTLVPDRAAFLTCTVEDPTNFIEVEINEGSLNFFGLKFKYGESNEEVEDSSNITDSKNTDQVTFKWGLKETKLLLDLYKQSIPNLGRTYALRTKSKLWQELAKMMVEKNYFFTPTQVMNRIKTLERGYKSMLNKKTCRARDSCEFQNELEDLFLKKKPKHPEYTPDSSEGSSASACELTSSDLVEDRFLSRSPSVKRRKKASREFQLKRGLLEIEKKKVEAMLERNKELKRKNDLLEELIKLKKIKILNCKHV